MRWRNVFALGLVVVATACGGVAPASSGETELRVEEPSGERVMIFKVGEAPYDDGVLDAGPPYDAELPWFGPTPAGNEPPHHIH